jgi:hypothetical protein
MFQVLYIRSTYASVWLGYGLKAGSEQCTGKALGRTATVRGTARRPYFSRTIISATLSSSDVRKLA